MKPVHLAPAFLLVAVSACRTPGAEPPAPRPPAEPDAVVEAPAVEDAMFAPQDEDRLDPFDAVLLDQGRRLLAQWVDAQNRKDFDAYIALYHTELMAEVRSGESWWLEDLAGWTQRRARDFQNDDFEIAVEDATGEHDPDAGGYALRFTYRYRSDDAAHHGEKVLVIDGGRIRYEENGAEHLGWDDAVPTPRKAEVVEAVHAWLDALASQNVEVVEEALSEPFALAYLHSRADGLCSDGASYQVHRERRTISSCLVNADLPAEGMKYAVTVERVRSSIPSDLFDGTKLPAGPGVRYVTVERDADDKIDVDAAVAIVDGEPRVIGAEVFIELADD